MNASWAMCWNARQEHARFQGREPILAQFCTQVLQISHGFSGAAASGGWTVRICPDSFS
jgi:hypothetical protein